MIDIEDLNPTTLVEIARDIAWSLESSFPVGTPEQDQKRNAREDELEMIVDAITNNMGHAWFINELSKRP